MPWNPREAKGHTKKAGSPKRARQWSHTANAVLERTGDEGQAVRIANSVVKKSHAKRDKHERHRATSAWAEGKGTAP